jgi:signal peptidase I
MIRGDEVYVDGRRLEESYLAPAPPPRLESGPCRYAYGCEPIAVLASSYFVMGDNRDHSHDSRSWGFVSRGLLVGRVRLVYWSWDGHAKQPRWARIGRGV